METSPTLHCFPGDAPSLSIILLADYLGVSLQTRFLKPVNAAEKMYKSSISKKFPMLEVKEGDSNYLIERSIPIINHLIRSSKNQQFGELTGFSNALGDQNIDYINQTLLPPLLTLKAFKMSIIESDKKLEKRCANETVNALKTLCSLLETQNGSGLLKSDFLLFTIVRTCYDLEEIREKIIALSILKERWSLLSKDEKFAKLMTPHIIKEFL